MKNNLTFSLFKVLFRNIFSFQDFLQSFKKGPKEVVKNIAILLCIIYCVGAFGVMYTTSMIAYYHLFDMAGVPNLLPLIGLLSCVIITLFFGFLSVASNYYTGVGEEQFLAMPLTPKNIFCAKFAVTFTTEALLGIFFFAISSIIYGYNQHLLLKPSFYIGLIVTAITAAVVSVFIIYLLLVIVLTLIPAFRKRSILTGVASVFIVLFAFAFSLSETKPSVAFTEGNIDSLSPMIDVLIDFSEKVPVLKFFSSAISGNWFAIFVLLLVFCIFVFILTPLLSKLYIKSLNGFSAVKSKRLSSEQASQVVNKELKVNAVVKSLYWRDVKTVFREPSFFANGPLMVFLFPLIMVFSFATGFLASGEETLGSILSDITEFWNKSSPEMLVNVRYYIILGISGFAIFIATSSSIGSTAFSREGKSMYDLKALPITPDEIVLAKLWHALSYVFISIVEIALFFIILVICLHIPYSLPEMLEIILNMIVVTIVISLLLIFVDMFIDTANPKLTWENPMAAFKQNINSLFGILITIGVVAIYIGLSIVLKQFSSAIYILCAFFLALDLIIGSAYFRYARKKIPMMFNE